MPESNTTFKTIKAFFRGSIVRNVTVFHLQ
jgi:hypothetical protein